MIDYFKDNNIVVDNNEIEEQLKELEEDQQRHIQKLYDRGEIIDYKLNNKNSNDSNSNGKANKKQQLNPALKKLQTNNNNNNTKNNLSPGNEVEILNTIEKLRRENPDLTFEQWSNTLKEKRQKLNDKVNEYFPEISLELDFILSIKTILNIEDVTLPFMGIVFAVPSSMKTKVIEILRKWNYSYFTDKFTPKSFVSHSATVAKDKLKDVDLLPKIKNKILLTPELSPLFTGKDEDIKEQFGIITRLLDGNGLETESGVHGKRGYYGDYMFTWIGAAVDIPPPVYKFLSTIGFKIYFLRLPRIEVSEDELVDQITTEKPFNEKIRAIEKLLIDYLIWFEICPISIGLQNIAKMEWDKSTDDKNAIRIIARLAILLARLRGNIYVYKTSDHEDLVIPIIENMTTNNSIINYSEGFTHSIPTIENPSRANQQLYNLARGHALAHGRNYITEEDIPLIIKVVLSTGSIERVLILDLLIANNGTLTTSQITMSMRISNNTAKRTMTEFKGLDLVTMERADPNRSNSEYKITLNSEFDWFLTDEFKNLRDDFKPTTDNNNDQLKSESETKCCDEKSPCVPTNVNSDDSDHKKVLSLATTESLVEIEGKKREQQPDNKFSSSTSEFTSGTDTTSNDNDIYSHRGDFSHSKNNTTVDVANNIQSDSADDGTTLPSSTTAAFTTLMPPSQQQSMESKIQAGLFTNSLIPISDLLIGNYDPEIINNIDRVHPNSDRWCCYNCTLRDNKWGMMKHLCMHNKRKENKEN